MDLLDAIPAHDGAVGTKEIVDYVECHRDTARRRLNELTDEGVLTRRDVGDTALWMLAEEE